MLLNDFFRIASLQQDNAEAGVSPGAGITAMATLKLDPEHAIFKGHFPGQPVVPGACLLQLVQEMTALVMGKECRLLKGDQIKFISMIDPGTSPLLELALRFREDIAGDLQVSAELSSTATATPAEQAAANTTPCFKFKGTFRSA